VATHLDISLYEFNSLNEFHKGEALWEYGIHVSQRTEGEIGYSLYQLHDFYVEVKYNGRINAITKFTSFSTHTKLEPYLEKIDISRVNEL
jgi:hypothetical protein